MFFDDDVTRRLLMALGYTNEQVEKKMQNITVDFFLFTILLAFINAIVISCIFENLNFFMCLAGMISAGVILISSFLYKEYRVNKLINEDKKGKLITLMVYNKEDITRRITNTDNKFIINNVNVIKIYEV